MQRRPITSIFIATLCVCFITQNVRASSNNAQAGSEKMLATDPQWLALLHMRKNPLTGNYHSEVDANSFFLSGKSDDSTAELAATITALQQPLHDDASAWCRFPARALFLAQHLTLHAPTNLHCSALDTWRKQFSADTVTLVYPDPYLKKIASIFGHTFLRFDAKDKKRNPILLSQTVSYYADVGATDNSAALYIAKGLTGHFPGIISLDPYFEKLREYSDSEDRDIREYHLSLSPDKVKMLIDHIWEVRGNSFNYFFLDENCSYRLIALLDVVTSTHNLREQFTTHTIPVDTVKVLQSHHLIASAYYIPSARKKFYADLATLSPAQNQQLKNLLRGKKPVEQISDAHVLSLAEKYHSIQIQSDPAKKALHTLQVQQVIQQQFKINTATPEKAITLTAPDPATEGHDMMRLQTGWQHDNGKDYIVLGTRFAYHDFHDPLTAYQKGVQLDVLDFQWRMDPSDNTDISLDRIRWFNLQSYSPSDIYFQEASWGVSAVRQRELIDEKERLANVAEGYRGITKNCGDLLCHAEFIGGALTSGAFNKDWDVRAGVRAGVLYQNNRWSWSADISQQQYFINSGDTLTDFSTEAGYRLSQNLAAYFSYSHQENDNTKRDRFLLSLRTFF